MKFVDIKNDIALSKIFGNQKKSIVLISFLNAVLDLEGLNRIKKVNIINPYLLPRIVGEKASIIDVRATDQRGRQFIVEMQVADKKGFEKRVQYYTARDFSMQIEKGDDYPKLKPTYFIGILNFKIGFGKNYLAKHYIPEDTGDEGLITAYKEADKHAWKKEELIAYDNASMREQDIKGEMEFAHEKGREEKEKEAVLGLSENGVPFSIIAKSLKITEERVEAIIKKHQNPDPAS